MARGEVKMQRRHFEVIAAALAEAEPPKGDGPAARAAWRETVAVLARRLAHTNEGFNEGRFLAACGYVEGECIGEAA